MSREGFSTFELCNSTALQRAWITGVMLIVQWEKLDSDTWNATMPDEKADMFTDWAESEGLPCRLV